MARTPLDLDELVEHWTLLKDEQALVSGKRGATRLGFAVLLKFYTQYGRFPRNRTELPGEAVEFIARQVQVPASELESYGWTGHTVEYHRAQIREHFGFRECSVADAEKLTAYLAEHVAHKERRPEQVRFIRSQVDAALAEFLDRKACEAAADGFPSEIIEVLRDFVFAGGKRLRPLLCVVGWHAAGGQDLPGSVVRVAACLEMFHAFTLIHDDIMDSSHTRRGAPTVHRALAARYAARSDAAQLGVNTAILIGDLALAWSDEILHTAGLTSARLAHVLPVVDRMRTEITRGQYLDLLATGQPGPDTDRALDIARYKTAKYTVERPLHIGATLAGAGAAALDALSAYALPTGEAFQLRDDLLGTFGTVTTGKSRVDDLRDGKHTILITLALRNASDPQRQALHALLGDPHLDEEGADQVRHLITTTGARDEAEDMIRTRHARALHALEQAALPPAATAALRYLADAAIARNA